MSTEPTIKPFREIWLRPRHVFRALADKPIDIVDFALCAAQGVAGSLYYSKLQNAGQSGSLSGIVGKSFIVGAVVGTASLFLMAVIYSRLSRRAGAPVARNQTMHVLAYGGIPIAASLLLWLSTAALIGEVTFLQKPPPDTDFFIEGWLQLLMLAHGLLSVWSVILQIMGFSEFLGLTTGKSFAIWILGQLIGLLAVLFLALFAAALLPGSITG